MTSPGAHITAGAAPAAPRNRWVSFALALGLLAFLLLTQLGERRGASSSSSSTSFSLQSFFGLGESSSSSSSPPPSAGAPGRRHSSPSFNIIITTATRTTLPRLLASISHQLRESDHLTVISDRNHEQAGKALADAPCKCTKRHIANPEPLGFWGHGSRTRWQNELPGDYHMNADDDDLYDPQAMDSVRRAVNGNMDGHLYVFHMIRRWDRVVELIPPRGWNTVAEKRIGTPCGVYRKIPDLPPWHGAYGGDATFYVALARRLTAANVTFVGDVIYQVGQDEDLLAIKDSVD